MKRVTIYLGSRCNLSCEYCHREAEENEDKGLPESFYIWLKEMAEQDSLSIKFMGGEPTLYFSTIEKIVNTVPDADFCIATNGLNLDQYLPFLEAHNFTIVLSYDGSDTDLRGFDPLSKLFNYPQLSISTTLYHGNTDFHKILQHFKEKEKLIGRPVSFFPHIMHYTNLKNKKYRLTKKDYDYILRQYKECISELIVQYKKTGKIMFKYTGLFSSLFRRLNKNYQFGETYCVYQNTWKIGPTGKSVSCLYIRDVKLSDDWQNEQAALLKQNFPECKDCPVYGMCGAGCHKSLDHAMECKFFFRLYSWFSDLSEKESAIWRIGNELE